MHVSGVMASRHLAYKGGCHLRAGVRHVWAGVRGDGLQAPARVGVRGEEIAKEALGRAEGGDLSEGRVE
eukprot:6985683-Prymnesium_polylepis.1